MIWTKQNFENVYPFLDDLKIHVASSNYGTLSTIQLNIVGEKFKYSNLPLIVKRLKKAQKSSELAVNLLDILGHEAVLKQVYQEMKALGNIEFLKLDATQIMPDITALTSLKGLIISGQSTETLPDYLSELPNLIWLDAAEIRLNTIPDCVFKLPLLRGVKLKPKSAMKQLPMLFDSLPQLEFLELLGCGITSLPENVTNLSKLKALSLESNKFVKLPKSFATLTNLDSLVIKVDTKVADNKHQYHLPKQLTHLILTEKDDTALTVLATLEENICSLRTTFSAFEQNLSALPFLSKLKTIFLAEANTGKGNEAIFQGLSVLKSLETVNLDYFQDVFTRNLRHLKQVKHLKMRLKPTSDLSELGEMTSLESLALHLIQYNHKVFVLPESLNNLQHLQSLELDMSYNSVKTDFTFIKQLPALKTLTLDYPAIHFNTFLEHNPQLEILGGGGLDEELPALRQLTHLTSFILPTAVFGDAVPSQIQGFKYLENLHLIIKQADDLTELKTFLTDLGQIPSFKRIEIAERYLVFSDDWHVLNQLPHIETEITVVGRPPTSKLGLLPQARLKTAGNWADGVLNEYFEKFEHLKKYDLSPEQSVIFYGMLIENMSDLRENIENNLPHSLKKDANVYLCGKLYGITKPQAVEKLKEKGVNVANKLTDEVTHIIFGNGLSIEEAAKIARSGKELALSEYLTEWLNSPDDFYLLQEENLELTQNIIPLLLSEEHSNHQLALEMLKGGGVTKRLLNYLFVFQGCHPNLDIRKDARKLFKRFAPADLYQEVSGSRRWEYMKGELTEQLFTHPFLDYWDSVLAYQQFRNNIVDERLRKPWAFSRDQQNVLTITKTNILTMDTLPAELSLVRANGIIVGYLSPAYSIVDFEPFFEQILTIPKRFPQLSEHFYCQYGEIEKVHYQALKACFQNVHLTDGFKIKE